MKVIDARTGKELQMGQTVYYGDGTYLELVDVDEGLFSASAIVQTGTGSRQIRRQIPLVVRFFHPSYFMQKVAFIPS